MAARTAAGFDFGAALHLTFCATDVGAASFNEPIRIQSENRSRRDYVRVGWIGVVRSTRCYVSGLFFTQ